MEQLLPLANRIGAMLKDRRQTIVIAESSTGGLISAALLSVPGASSYFLGGMVVYTVQARESLLQITEARMEGMRASTEPYALLAARTARERFSATWALSETGATGPVGNRYGDSPGHSCVAIAGPVERTLTIETGSADRIGNMRAFGLAALELLARNLEAS